MRLRVLGCHGGELPQHRTTCFLVDGVLALDAGSLTQTLSLVEMDRLDDIVVGHAHFDHVKDLPLISDLMVGRRDRPILIHASTECARTLRTHMFNNAIWPDFTRIPTKAHPVIVIKAFKPGATFKVGRTKRYTIRTAPVTHPVESCGIVVSDGKSSLAMSGDTGPTDRLWKMVNRAPHLKAVLLETSFPNNLQGLADVSGHLTPNTLREELKKRTVRDAAVLLYHLKPAFVAQVKKELRTLAIDARVMELDEVYEL
jgi:cAMP phosphodiesterase